MNADTSKRCPKCDQSKPIDDFHRRRSSPDGRQANCASCMRRIGREQQWAKQGINITYEQYLTKVDAQLRCCAICGEEPDQDLAVDHDHDNGAVRDLLCVSCNVGLGAFRDNPALLRLAIAYLQEHGKE